MSIENRLKNARTKAGLTQSDLAEVLGISLRSMGRYEKNASTLTIAMASEIASVCKISLAWLVSGDGDMVNPVKYSGNIDRLKDAVEFECQNPIEQFQNKAQGKRLNDKLIKLENISASQLDRIEREIDKLVEISEEVAFDIKKMKNEPEKWNGIERRKVSGE